MTHTAHRRLAWCTLAAAALLAGCAQDKPMEPRGTKATGGAFQIFANPNKALSSKTCPATNPTCAVRVERTTERPVELPNKTWDCKIAVTDIVLVPLAVKKLDWELQANMPGQPEFRFTEPSGDNGVWTYADSAAFFGRERVADTVFRFNVLSDFKGGVGFAYGVRLEWRESPKAPWLPCDPRDPIIVSMD